MEVLPLVTTWTNLEDTAIWVGLSFGSVLSPKGSCVESLVPADGTNGRWWKLEDVGPSWKRSVTGGMDLKGIFCPRPFLWFSVTMRRAAQLHHILSTRCPALPQTLAVEPANYGLKPETQPY